MTENLSYLSWILDSYRNETELGLGWAAKLFALMHCQQDTFLVSENDSLDAQIQRRRPLFAADVPQLGWILHLSNVILGRISGNFWTFLNQAHLGQVDLLKAK